MPTGPANYKRVVNSAKYWCYKPDAFKAPGGTNVNIGTRGDVFVLTEEQRHILMDYKRSELLAWTPPRPTEEPTAPPRELGEGDSTWTKSSATTPTTCDEK